jgi:hypothetical protein
MLGAPTERLAANQFFSGSVFIRTTISEKLRSPRKFLAPRVFHPPSSIIHAP